MNTWTEPYEDEYIKERIEEIRTAQQEAQQRGEVRESGHAK